METPEIDNASIEQIEAQEPATEEMAQTKEQSRASVLAAMSISELIEELKAVVAKDYDDQQKSDAEMIKPLFYKKVKAELAAASEAIEPPTVDYSSEENELKSLFSVYHQKRTKYMEDQNALRLKNLEVRKGIIAAIKGFVEHPENIHEHVSEVRDFQQKWRVVGQIPVTEIVEINKEYNNSIEQFYDLLKINIELRDYDFKKNLEAKTALCEEAERLETNPDVVVAFRRLQQLHEEWAQIGPIAKDLREALWNRFKAASTIVNRNHNTHFETLKKEEESNLLKKTALCERLDAISYDALKSVSDWDKQTKEVLALQAEWKTIGYCSKKTNEEIYERYRTACNSFFDKKREFFKTLLDVQNENLKKKQALVAKAEELKESTDWAQTTKVYVELQKEWKTIGGVPRKYVESVWKQFTTVCNYFFDRKEENFKSQRTEETENLQKKEAVIEKIENFKAGDNDNESVDALKVLMAEYNAIGHVPYKNKEKIYKRYKAACDAQFDVLHVEASNRRLENFGHNMEVLSEKGGDLNKELLKLRFQEKRMEGEIRTVENNLSFVTSSSKKPNPLMEQMQKNVEKQKSDLDLLHKKIATLEAQIVEGKKK